MIHWHTVKVHSAQAPSDDLDPHILADLSDEDCSALGLDQFECLYGLAHCDEPLATELQQQYGTGFDDECPGCEHCQPERARQGSIASHRIAELDDKLFQYHGIYQMRYGQPWKLLSIVRVTQQDGGSRLVYSAYFGTVN